MAARAAPVYPYNRRIGGLLLSWVESGCSVAVHKGGDSVPSPAQRMGEPGLGEPCAQPGAQGNSNSSSA